MKLTSPIGEAKAASGSHTLFPVPDVFFCVPFDESVLPCAISAKFFGGVAMNARIPLHGQTALTLVIA